MSEALNLTVKKFNLENTKEYEVTENIDIFNYNQRLHYLFKPEFIKIFENKLDPHKIDQYYNFITTKTISSLLKLNRESIIKEYNEIPNQEAIKSEVGVLKVEGITDLNKAFKDLNLTTIEEKVPYNILYPNKDRKGLVNFYSDEYLLGKELKIPFKAALLHGITGVENSEALVRRLEKIKETGALKSIAERRRSGIIVKSLSPIGDMASGIDMGVPCTLGLIPNFGNEAYFILKPSNLMKRNMFFSNEDFGGGFDRFDNFKEYGASIGHPNIYLPPSHKSRISHFQNIDLEDEDDDNEVYIKGEVHLKDIEAIVVKEKYYKKVKELAKGWEQEGLKMKVYKSFQGDYEELNIQTTNALVKEITTTFPKDLIENFKR